MDPAVFIAVPVLILAVVFVANYVPSRRSASIDPMTTLGCD